MIIDLIKLKNNIIDIIEIDEVISFTKDELSTTDLISLDQVHVKGYLNNDALHEIYLSLNISGVMVLPCAITLKPVNHPFNTSIEGNLLEILKEMNENARNIDNTIDILPIIWENILIEIPLKVVSEEAKNLELKGDGWKLVTEESKDVNNALAKLKDLL